MISHEARAAMRLTPPSSPLWSRVEAHVGIRHRNWKKDGGFPLYWAVGASKEEAKRIAEKKHGPFRKAAVQSIVNFLNFWLVAGIRGKGLNEIAFDEILPGTAYGLWGSSGNPLIHDKTDKLAHPHPKGTTGA